MVPRRGAHARARRRGRRSMPCSRCCCTRRARSRRGRPRLSDGARMHHGTGGPARPDTGTIQPELDRAGLSRSRTDQGDNGGNDRRQRRRHRRSGPLAARAPQRRPRDGAPGRPARHGAARRDRALGHRSRPGRPGHRRLRQPGRRADVQHRAQRVAERRPPDGGRGQHRRQPVRLVAAGHQPRRVAREVGRGRRRARRAASSR